MKNGVKLLIFSCLIFIYCIGLINFTGASVFTLYDGVSPSSPFFATLINYFLFSLYSFYFFEAMTRSVEGYGLLILMRVKNRRRIYNKQILNIVQFVFIFEVIKFVIYILIFELANDFNSNIFEYIKGSYFFIIANIFVIILFLLIQLFLEMKISSTIAILCTQIMYIVSLFLSDLFYNMNNDAIINWFFVQNYSMKLRFELFDFENLPLNGAYYIILLLIVFYVINMKVFDKKDLL